MPNQKTLKKELAKHLPDILFDEPLAKYSTFNIGGPADFFYKLKDTEELPSIIKFCNIHKIPFLIIGGGSNILFDDNGYRGLMIKIETQKMTIKNHDIIADAGVPIARLIQFSIENGLTGLEKWTGLPGTVGGAVRGNAGCNGLETKEVMVRASVLDPRTGKVKQANNKYFHYKYRYSKVKKAREIVLSAIFRLKKADITPSEQKAIIKEMHKNRIEKQPFGASCGSFFKNPVGNAAGFLIEQAGLKGKTLGKAQISKKHANFFLNLGGAKAKDILKLAALAQQKVKEKFDINLESEVEILDEGGLQKKF